MALILKPSQTEERSYTTFYFDSMSIDGFSLWECGKGEEDERTVLTLYVSGKEIVIKKEDPWQWENWDEFILNLKNLFEDPPGTSKPF